MNNLIFKPINNIQKGITTSHLILNKKKAKLKIEP